jgi:hypothetical protein
MCESVMVALPTEFDTCKLVHAEKLGAVKLSNASADPYRSNGKSFDWYFTSKYFCDCGTVIGYIRALKEKSGDLSNAKTTKLVKKWRRKNWSDAKIQRALASREADHSHKAELLMKQTAEDEQMYTPSAERWLSFLTECRSVLEEESFFIMKRWGSNEKYLPVDHEEQVRVNSLVPRDLMWWKEDVAYRCD